MSGSVTTVPSGSSAIRSFSASTTVDAPRAHAGTIHDSTGEACSADRCAQQDEEAETPQDHPAEDVALLAVEADRGGGDGEVLRRDHLAQHAAGTVRRGHQHLGEAGLVRGRHLQRTEQRVGRRVGTGDRHPEPAQDRRQQREGPARGRHERAQGDRLAGQVHHEGQREDGHDGDDRPPQLVQRHPVGLDRPRHRQAQRDHREHTGEQHLGARGGQQVQGELRQRRRIAVGVDHVEPRPVSRERRLLEQALHRRDLAEHEDADDDSVGRVRLDDVGAGVLDPLVAWAVPRSRGGGRRRCVGHPGECHRRFRRATVASRTHGDRSGFDGSV